MVWSLANLGGKALAALRAAGSDHPAAANASHTITKTVATFAHKFAGLVGSFHSGGSSKKLLLQKASRYSGSSPACQQPDCINLFIIFI